MQHIRMLLLRYFSFTVVLLYPSLGCGLVHWCQKMTTLQGRIINYNKLESRYANLVNDDYLVEILKQNDKFWTYFL